MMSKIRTKKVSDGGEKEQDTRGSLMRTSMVFDDNNLRAEWLLTNPGAKEEKFEPWLYDGVAGRREQMNSYNMQRLPLESIVHKQGFFIKSNQAQTSWKRRFFTVRAGMMVFFKDDPANQPPGVATIPQGAVPLEDCEASMPMNFGASFSFKPRKGVTGFELKLVHRSRRPFLFVFPTAAERLEWCNYLSHYILHSFLPDEFTNAAKVHDVESTPMYCLHQYTKEGEGPDNFEGDESGDRSSKKKQYLHLDWFSPDSSEWCLRLSAMKLQPSKMVNGTDGFDVTQQSLSTSLPLHRVTRVDLEGNFASLQRRATSPPILRTEATGLPRKPTFDISDQGEERLLDVDGRGGGGPVLVVHECLPTVSSAYSTLSGAAGESRCHRFFPVDGSDDSTREWYDAINAALQLQDSNATAQIQRQKSTPSLNDSSSRPGLFGLVGRSMSSKSALEFQNGEKNLERSNGHGETKDHDINTHYNRAEFLNDTDALEVTQRGIEKLSIAAESGSECEGNYRSNDVQLEQSSGVESNGNDVTFVVTLSKHRQLFPHQHQSSHLASTPSRRDGGVQNFKISSPRDTTVDRSSDSKVPGVVDSNALRPSVLLMNSRQTSTRQQAAVRNANVPQFGDDVLPPPSSPPKQNQSSGAQNEGDSKQIMSGELLDDDSLMKPPRGIFGCDYKSDSSHNGNSSEASLSSRRRRRVLLTKKGREERSRRENDSSNDTAGSGGRKSFSRLQRSFGAMDSKRKRRLSTVIANTTEKQNQNDVDKYTVDGDENTSPGVGTREALRRDAGNISSKAKVVKGVASSEAVPPLVIEYLREQRGLPLSQQLFQIDLNTRDVRVSKIAIESGARPNSQHISYKTIPLSNLVSAEMDLNGTGLMRIWLQLNATNSSAPVRVSWTVRAVGSRKEIHEWLSRLQALKKRERDERDLL